MPRREFLTGEEILCACRDDSKNYLWVRLENTCLGLPFGHLTSTPGSKDAAPTDASLAIPLHLHMLIFRKKKAAQGLSRTLSWRCDKNSRSRRELSNGGNIVETLGPLPPVETF